MTFIVTLELFKQVAPSCKTPQLFVDLLNKNLPTYGIDTYLEVAHFLAQYAFETQGFTKFVENTNYKTSDRLVTVFGKYFYKGTATPRKYNALEFVGKPDKIANVVYANRYGNKGPDSGDGFKFRGRGLCHLTFRDNYVAFQKDFGSQFKASVVDKPEQLEEATGAVLAGIWFWDKNKINIDATKNSVEAVTRKINGGVNGLEGRRSNTTKLLTYIKNNKL